jgi:hypothetical protein
MNPQASRALAIRDSSLADLLEGCEWLRPDGTTYLSKQGAHLGRAKEARSLLESAPIYVASDSSVFNDDVVRDDAQVALPFKEMIVVFNAEKSLLAVGRERIFSFDLGRVNSFPRDSTYNMFLGKLLRRLEVGPRSRRFGSLILAESKKQRRTEVYIIPNVSRASDLLEKSTARRHIEWSCRWDVAGHERKIKNKQTGETRIVFVRSHLKGPESKPLRKAIRMVREAA